jgi:ABC-type lipoprotein release transport system permease subunit
MIKKIFNSLRINIYVGFFMAMRDLKRANIWTTSLIVFMMALTFFNMILLGGILLGMADGMIGSFKKVYSANIFITPSLQKNIIEQTDIISIAITSIPGYKAYSKRLTASARAEYGYQLKVRESDKSDSIAATVVGIDPDEESKVTRLSQYIIAGSYLNKGDIDSVIVGKSLLDTYNASGPPSALSEKLNGVDIGDRIRLTIGKVEKEVLVVGVIATDNSLVDGRIFMVDNALRALLNRNDTNVNEIAVSLNSGVSESDAKKFIVNNINNATDIIVKTSFEAIPSASADITTTFSLLANIVGAIALIVGAITIFIVIYVNAITRRKYIGILKGIGISTLAIEISYVIQAVYYAVLGIVIMSIIITQFITPYFAIYPINLPLGKSSLAISLNDLLTRGIILTIASVISGFIPARMVARQNTLDAILGR